MKPPFDVCSSETEALWAKLVDENLARTLAYFWRHPIAPPTRWQRLRYKLSLPWTLRLGRYELRFGRPVDV